MPPCQAELPAHFVGTAGYFACRTILNKISLYGDRVNVTGTRLFRSALSCALFPVRYPDCGAGGRVVP